MTLRGAHRPIGLPPPPPPTGSGQVYTHPCNGGQKRLERECREAQREATYSHAPGPVPGKPAGLEAGPRDYGSAIYYWPTRRVWALSEELNALDRARSRTAGELLGEDKRDAFGVPLGRRMRNAWGDLLKAKENPADRFIPKR